MKRRNGRERWVRLVAMGAAACFGVACGGRAPEDAPGSAASVAASASPSDTRTSASRSGNDSTVTAAPAVLIAGTSLTAGLGLDPAEAYPAVLQRMADSAGYRVRIVNAGLSGETSAGLRRRIDWLLREPAGAVVIETGANDGLRGVEPDSTRENLLAIVRAVQAKLPGAPVFVVQMEAPPNLGERYTARFRAVFPDVAQRTGATLLPFLLEGVAGERGLNQGDGIHPNAEGAVRAAANVWPTLAPVLARLDGRG